MVFCAYCGKSFTRKEHLERHIPSHTNVKPHRCSACQLSFARRDLLQRHHSTYHEARDPMEPLPGGVPTVAGRTPIACQNCANAKTGCDKRVPCSRCAEKNLPCAARFARRSSKAAVRAAQASVAFNSQLSPAAQQPSLTVVSPSMMDLDQTLAQASMPGKASAQGEPGTTIDPRLQQSPQQKKSPAQSRLSPDGVPSPHIRLDGLDDFMQLNNEFVAPDSSYQDLLVWPEYQIELDMYSSGLSVPRADISMPIFGELSDASPNSEPMTAASSRGSVHTRGTSIISSGDYESLKPIDPGLSASNDNSIPEFEVVVASENSWPLARCNPPTFSGNCPRTAIVHLEALEQKCKQDGTWDSLEKYLGQFEGDAASIPSLVSITSRTRDKMTAITQGFLHKALDIHRAGVSSFSKSGYNTPGGAFNFIMLPPSHILEYFLRSYVRSLSDYYTLVFASCVDPNEMLHNNQASTLLVLLMIAQGAAAVPMAEARYLSAGLTETCRISLFDIIEKDVELSADPTALRCALLFTLLGSWSGDKWQMDIAMGQRGMYISMLKHAGMLEPQSSMIPAFNSSTSPELQWRAWTQREAQNRLVYNWVFVDLELSIFHDTAPILAVSELQCPLPSPDVLWVARDSEQWLAGVQSLYGCTANVNPQLLTTPSLTPSLCDLFQDFLHDNLSRRQSSLSPQQLRLLLHPIQSLLCHLRQMLSCFSDVLATRRTTGRTLTKASTLLRLEEVQSLLQNWYELTMSYLKANPNCAVTRCNLVLYHLLSLNAITSFSETERLARRDDFDGSYWELSLRHKRCIYQREEAIFRCGQIFRLLRLMPADQRPIWWTAAVYRATLILWADSISHMDPNFPTKQKEDGSPGATNPVAVDQVVPEDATVIAYLWNGDGIAVLTRKDGSTVSLDNPADILSLGIQAIEEGVSSRIGDGIRRKLMTLSNNWSVESMNAGPA